MGKKKHRRYLTKDEILASMRKVRDIKQTADRSPFTGISILANYVLWKEEGKGQKKLAEYNQIVNGYETAINAGEVTVEELSARVWEKGHFKIEFEPWENATCKNNLVDRLNAELINANNVIHQYAARHLTVHFASLIDLGYGKKRLERNKDWINDYLRKCDNDEMHIMDMHQELVDKVGIYIERPKIDPEMGAGTAFKHGSMRAFAKTSWNGM